MKTVERPTMRSTSLSAFAYHEAVDSSATSWLSGARTGRPSAARAPCATPVQIVIWLTRASQEARGVPYYCSESEVGPLHRPVDGKPRTAIPAARSI